MIRSGACREAGKKKEYDHATSFCSGLGLSCVAATTPSFARGGGGQTGSRAIRSAGYAPISLSAYDGKPNSAARNPVQPPVINGPLSQPNFRGLTGIGECGAACLRDRFTIMLVLICQERCHADRKRASLPSQRLSAVGR